MTKKKSGGSLVVGIGEGYDFTYGSPSVYDNNPDGPSNHPDFKLDGTRYPNGKFSFVDLVAPGEAADRPDVIVQTANGTQKSQGQNKGQQGNYCPDSSWAESKKWNGNMSGM